MFQSPHFIESRSGRVNIEGCSPDALKGFLEMLLSGNPSTGSISDVALSTFVLADRYNIKSLKDHCVPYIIKDLDANNCLEILTTSYLHNNEAMTEAALEVLRANKTTLMASEEWSRVVTDHPKLASQLLFKVL